MSDPKSWDKVKRYLPPDEDVDQALRAALRAEEARLTAPRPAPPLATLRENSPVTGRVVGVQEDRVLLDISYKAEAVVPLAEFGGTAPAIGTAITGWVMRIENADGQVELSVREAERRRIFEDVGTGARPVVRGRIVEAVKGGLIVDIGMRAFLPAKELELRFVEDLAPYVGRESEFKVLEVDRAERRVILSRRALLQEERAKQKEALFAELAPGQIRKGIVSKVTEFGAFVDLGGADGLIHRGDLAWGRVERPEDVLRAGDEVRVAVLSFDRASGKIGLSLREAGPSPWDSAAIRYAKGTRHRGRVTGLLDFGAMVELEPGVQGLVHLSEMSWKRRVRRAEEAVSLGQSVEVEVVEVHPEKKRIALSMKRVEENPWARLEQRYPFATIVEGTVVELTDFGAFLELEDGVQGLVHVSEISWTQRPRHPGELLAVGQRTKAIVLGADGAEQRLSLSIRNLEPDPWWDAEKDFPPGSRHPARITRIESFGAFAALRTGLEGLIHVSRLGGHRGQRAEDLVRVGEEVQVKVLEISEEKRRASLELEPDAGGD
jgi:small subunit ribosomal protein S1